VYTRYVQTCFSDRRYPTHPTESLSGRIAYTPRICTMYTGDRKQKHHGFAAVSRPSGTGVTEAHSSDRRSRFRVEKPKHAAFSESDECSSFIIHHTTLRSSQSAGARSFRGTLAEDGGQRLLGQRGQAAHASPPKELAVSKRTGAECVRGVYGLYQRSAPGVSRRSEHRPQLSPRYGTWSHA